MELYSSTGHLLAAADGGTNDQNLTLTLPAGNVSVLVSSHGDYGDLGEYSFSARQLPAGWSTRNIGTVIDGGYAGYNPAGSTFAIGGSGDDIWNTADSFRYAYTQLAGDGSITARVVNQENTSVWSKVGVMVRESLASNSKHAMTVVTPANGVAFQWRDTTGGNSGNVNSSGVAEPSYWVRVTRIGNILAGFASSNGANWTQISSATVSMSA